MAGQLPPLPIQRNSKADVDLARALSRVMFDLISNNHDPVERLQLCMSAATFLCGMTAGAYEMANPGARKPSASEMMRLLADRIEHEERARDAGVSPFPERPN